MKKIQIKISCLRFDKKWNCVFKVGYFSVLGYYWEFIFYVGLSIFKILLMIGNIFDVKIMFIFNCKGMPDCLMEWLIFFKKLSIDYSWRNQHTSGRNLVLVNNSSRRIFSYSHRHFLLIFVFQSKWGKGSDRRTIPSWAGIIWEEDQAVGRTEWSDHQRKGRYPFWKSSFLMCRKLDSFMKQM